MIEMFFYRTIFGFLVAVAGGAWAFLTFIFLKDNEC